MRIALKMMFVSMAVIVAVTLLLSWFLLQQQDAVFLSRAEEVASRFGHQASRSLAGRSPQERAEQLARLNDWPASDVHTQTRWVWFDRGPRDGGPDLSVSVQTLTRQQIVNVPHRDPDGTLKLYSYIQVDDDQSPPGGVEFVQSIDQLEAARDAAMRAIGVLAGTLLIVSTGAIGLASVVFLARPLSRLTNKVHRIAEGDLSSPLDVHSRDELGLLAQGMNLMCERLNVAKQSLRDESNQKVAAVEALRHEDRMRTVGRLASGVAHELGTPLAVVQGRAQMIAAESSLAPKVADSAEHIVRESQRMSQIIRQLLDFARHAKPHRTVCSLNQILQQTVELCQPLTQRSGVTLQLIDSPVVRVNVDANQIQQVMMNVTMNAAEAMPDGGQVTLRLSDDPGPQVEITDAGPGIREEDLAQIFDPFFTTKPTGEGTGLGLSIARRIMEEHGGRIDVSSELGRGTTFTLTF